MVKKFIYLRSFKLGKGENLEDKKAGDWEDRIL